MRSPRPTRVVLVPAGPAGGTAGTGAAGGISPDRLGAGRPGAPRIRRYRLATLRQDAPGADRLARLRRLEDVEG